MTDIVEKSNMLNLHIPDMSCGHCKKTVEDAVHSVDQSATVEFDMDKRMVSITTQIPASDVINALSGAGYTASSA